MRYTDFKDPDTYQPNRYTLPTHKRREMNRHMTHCSPSYQDHRSKLARFKSDLNFLTSHLTSHQAHLDKLHEYLSSQSEVPNPEPEPFTISQKPPTPLLGHRTWSVAHDFRDKISQINTFHILESIDAKSQSRLERSHHLSELRNSTLKPTSTEVKELYTNSLYILHN
jgi:hypothetical protein